MQRLPDRKYFKNLKNIVTIETKLEQTTEQFHSLGETIVDLKLRFRVPMSTLGIIDVKEEFKAEFIRLMNDLGFELTSP